MNEALSLRIKDINFESKSIFNGKGRKDRYTLLPNTIITPLKSKLNT
ncbi:site-specific integrase [Photobacterium leiognathi]|nr:hypothetical protein [Photobacterium leiognathi]